MKLTLDSGKTIEVSEMSLEQWRRFMSEFMRSNPNSGAAWDIMGCVRGPDSPSERPDMDSKAHHKAYDGRRQRKRETVEVIREAMFYGVCNGGARHHKADHVTLPPHLEWDHFDRHVQVAAQRLGLKIKIKGTD